MNEPSHSPERAKGRQVEDRERLGVLFILGLVTLIGVAILIFSFAGNAAGLVFIVVAGGVAAWLAVRYERRGPVEVPERRLDARHRVLVLANEGRGGEQIVQALSEGSEPASAVSVQVVVPALAEPVQRLASDVDTEARQAEGDLRRIIDRIQSVAGRVEGHVGAEDPRLALEDALRTFPADEVIIANPPGDEIGPLEESVRQRSEDVPIPVREVRA